MLSCRDLFEETDSIDSAAVAPPSRMARGGKSAYKLNSVGARFRKQLQGLMGTLNQCQPHYIRSDNGCCITCLVAGSALGAVCSAMSATCTCGSCMPSRHNKQFSPLQFRACCRRSSLASYALTSCAHQHSSVLGTKLRCSLGLPHLHWLRHAALRFRQFIFSLHVSCF